MPFYICETCGTQYAETARPPEHCPVCEDERQYVGWHGQRWTTHSELSQRHSQRLEDDAGLLGIGTVPAFAINQRALLLPTDAGNILWECVSLVTEQALTKLKSCGGVDMIVISHPHFYAAMVDWSEALGGVPVLIHEADKTWLPRASKRIHFWGGDKRALSDSVTLLRLGGHFPGSTGLHWRDGPRKGGALFPGDAIHVAADRRNAACMYSYPNFIPMSPGEVKRIQALIAAYAFDDVFGFTWGRNILGGARAAVDASFARYLQAIAS